MQCGLSGLIMQGDNIMKSFKMTKTLAAALIMAAMMTSCGTTAGKESSVTSAAQSDSKTAAANSGAITYAMEDESPAIQNAPAYDVADAKTYFDSMPEIRELVRQRGLEGSVIFVGTTLDIPQILSAMDFMVLPSLFEGLPNVLIEWQASGLPALVADTVTAEAKLTDLVTFLPLDADTWSRAMLEQPHDESARPEASARAARDIAAAGYDIKTSAASLRALYERYVDEAYGR